MMWTACLLFHLLCQCCSEGLVSSIARYAATIGLAFRLMGMRMTAARTEHVEKSQNDILRKLKNLKRIY